MLSVLPLMARTTTKRAAAVQRSEPPAAGGGRPAVAGVNVGEQHEQLIYIACTINNMQTARPFSLRGILQ